MGTEWRAEDAITLLTLEIGNGIEMGVLLRQGKVSQGTSWLGGTVAENQRTDRTERPSARFPAAAIRQLSRTLCSIKSVP